MTNSLTTSLITALSDKGWMIRAAESCTAGLIMAELTNVSGSSAVVDRGFVTYSNQAKQEMLGVQDSTLATYGAVSAQTAFEMLKGCVPENNQTYCAVCVTGIAGPQGGTADKPVGTVWIGALVPDKEPLVRHYLFAGARDEVRRQTTEAALEQLMSLF